MALDPTVIALVGTVFGGVGLKVVEHWLAKNKIKVDEATTLRTEMRLELTTLRTENRQLEIDVDRWKQEYYDVRQKLMLLEVDMKLSGRDPPDE